MTALSDIWLFQKIKDLLRNITSQSSDKKQQQFDIPEGIPLKELSSIVSKTWSTGCRFREVGGDRIEEQKLSQF
jgi:hypothetical protein